MCSPRVTNEIWAASNLLSPRNPLIVSTVIRRTGIFFSPPEYMATPGIIQLLPNCLYGILCNLAFISVGCFGLALWYWLIIGAVSLRKNTFGVSNLFLSFHGSEANSWLSFCYLKGASHYSWKGLSVNRLNLVHFVCWGGEGCGVVGEMVNVGQKNKKEFNLMLYHVNLLNRA